MLSRAGSESAARRGPPRPPPSRPVPTPPIEFAFPDDAGRVRESTVRAGTKSAGHSPRSSVVDHRFVNGLHKNGELRVPFESIAGFRDSGVTESDSDVERYGDDDQARAYDIPPGTATTSDEARVASSHHRPTASISSRAPVSESNTRWSSAARSRSGSLIGVSGAGLSVNTASYLLEDQDDYGAPSPGESPPDPDGMMSQGEYGGIVGPRRDLYSDDELESVVEENESESLVSDDDLAIDREDRTAAMIIADEGRGQIVDANDRPVSQLDVEQGTTHLLLSQNPTPDRLLPFLATILPQISFTLLCLDLSSNQLATLPPALTACTNLEELNISSNPLRTLPPTIGALTNLRVLIADACDLVALPTQLANLGALHSLSVRSNRLVMLPVWMHTMNALEILKVDGNAFVGPWRGVVEPLLSPPPRSGSYDSHSNSHENGVYGPGPGARAASSYPMLVETPPMRGQVQRSYSQQPSGSSPYLPASRPSTVHSTMTHSPLPLYSPLPPGGHSPLPQGAGYSASPQSAYSPLPVQSPPLPPPPPSATAALNLHLGALGPASGGIGRKKKKKRSGSVSDPEGESEYDATGSAVSWEHDATSTVGSVAPSPRRMKSADELRRMGMPPPPHPPLPPPPPPPEDEEFGLSQEPGQMKRYVSLGARAAPSARPDARGVWGQRHSAAAPGSGMRSSGVGVGQRTSGYRTSTARADDEGSPDVSFEEKHEPTSPEDRRKGRWGFFKKVSMGRLRSHSNAERLGRTLPAAQLGNMPDVPQRTPVSPIPPQPIAAPSPAPPRVDVTSAGSPASSVLTARMLQHKSSREMLSPNGGGLQPTGARAKRRSFLPFDTPPTLNIPIPSTEPFMSGVVAVGDDAGAGNRDSGVTEEEEQRAQIALRGVMAYLRDMSDLGAGAAGGAPARSASGKRPPLSTTVSDGSSAASTPALRSAPSTASLRGGQDSVVTTDSSGSYGQGFAEDRKYKDDKGKRAAIVKEIIETEKSYVKGLQELMDIYVKPASEPAPGLNVNKETIVPAQERKIVFTGVDALLQFHKLSFLPSLIAAAAMLNTGVDDPNGQISTMAAHGVANVFVTHAAFMKMYFTYINNFDNAIQRLQFWSAPPSSPGTPGSATPSAPASATVGIGMSMVAMGVTGITPDPQPHTATLNAGQRKRIKQFLKRARIHPRHSQLNLEGYLLLPIQRIPRYKMLLDNLVTCTPPRPEATDDPLERALEEIAVLASSMNEGKRESESRNKLVQWQSRIRGKFISPLVQPHRRLIMDGRLHLVRLVKKVSSKTDVSNPDGTLGQIEVPCLSSDANPKQLVAILCNDLLVLCKETPGADYHNSHVELWAVLRMQTMAQPASIVSGNGLRIVDNKAILYFNTQSTSEALTWQRAINLHIPHSQ
ncbi:guanine exchange factor for Rac 30 [Ceratobasidium sp. AG-Ba]|nr:guanine exchange factor for Rac 30 [Ceratobasidium sp. AG-Ba]